ncbi:hypothetical protein [Streptomyces sp. NPDC005181]|uniref:hypothetical protein n=1 Tax=Streptomyces sp. NPDC005181 TaxID=3156869 RepID=UPI0033B2F692
MPADSSFLWAGAGAEFVAYFIGRQLCGILCLLLQLADDGTSASAGLDQAVLLQLREGAVRGAEPRWAKAATRRMSVSPGRSRPMNALVSPTTTAKTATYDPVPAASMR